MASLIFGLLADREVLDRRRDTGRQGQTGEQMGHRWGRDGGCRACSLQSLCAAIHLLVAKIRKQASQGHWEKNGKGVDREAD